jgi:hypothetical protein
MACAGRSWSPDVRASSVPASQGIHLSKANFLMWALSAVWNSLIVFFVSAYILSEPDQDGREPDMYVISMAIFSAMHVLVHLKLFVATASFTWITVVSGHSHRARGLFRLRCTSVTPVLFTKLRMESPSQVFNFLSLGSWFLVWCGGRCVLWGGRCD